MLDEEDVLASGFEDSGEDFAVFSDEAFVVSGEQEVVWDGWRPEDSDFGDIFEQHLERDDLCTNVQRRELWFDEPDVLDD